MLTKKTLSVAACAIGLVGLSGLLPATAHHQEAGSRQFLAFWSGYQPPSRAEAASGTCKEGRFWEKGFVSIYATGENLDPAR